MGTHYKLLHCFSVFFCIKDVYLEGFRDSTRTQTVIFRSFPQRHLQLDELSELKGSNGDLADSVSAQS